MCTINKVLLFSVFILFPLCVKSDIALISYENADPSECNGKINIEIESGSLPIDIHINGELIEIDIEIYSFKNLCSGNYTLSYQDEVGCPKEIHVVLEDCGNFDIDHSLVKPCFGIENGSITINNQPQDFSYIWSNGSTSPSLTNIKHGDYYLTVTNQQNCSQVYYYQLQPILLEIEVVDVNPTTNGTNDRGRIEIEAIGENDIEAYQWRIVETDGTDILTEETILSRMYPNDNVLEFDWVGFNVLFQVTVEDDHGCRVSKNISIQSCPSDSSNDNFTVGLNLSETSTCENGIFDHVAIAVGGYGTYFNYTLINTANQSVVENEFVNIDNNNQFFIHSVPEGDYNLLINNECGSPHLVQFNLICEPCNIPSRFPDHILSGYNIGCDHDHDDPVVLYSQSLAVISQEMKTYCSSDVGNDWTVCQENSYFQVIISDGAIIQFETDNSWEDIQLRKIKDGSQTSLINNDTQFETVLEHNQEILFSVYFAQECNYNGSINSIISPPYEVYGNAVGYLFGELVQFADFNCITCHDLNYYGSFIDVDATCENEFGGDIDYYDYDPNDDEFPCAMGGIFDVFGLGQVIIPAGTPYTIVSNSQAIDDKGPDCVRCLFAAGYASDHVFPDLPVYVTVCPENPGDDPVVLGDGEIDYDPECETETVDPGVDCYVDIVCNDENDPYIIETVPNWNSIYPCRDLNMGACTVVGWCAQSNDYFLYDNQIFNYPTLNCDIGGFIPLCANITEENISSSYSGTLLCYNDYCDDDELHLFEYIWSGNDIVFNNVNWNANYDSNIPYCLEIGLDIYDYPDEVLPTCFTGGDDENGSSQRQNNKLNNRFESFGIYPNPSKDFFTVINKQGASNENIIYSLTIYDVDGKVMFNKENLNFNDGKVNIHHEIRSGFYFVKISNPNREEFTSKLIILN